jgi:hypothetical protein
MKVITPVCNSIQFIHIQYVSLKQYMQIPYEFIVFNDAKDFPDSTNFGDASLRMKIRAECEKYGIQCIDVPNDSHRYIQSPSERHCMTVQYMMNYIRENPDQYLMLDSDMFPIANVPSYTPIAIVLQERSNMRYAWPNLWNIDVRTVGNLEILDWNLCPDCDTGGMSQVWLSLQETMHRDQIYYIPHLVSCQWDASSAPSWMKTKLLDFMKNDPRNQNGKFWCELYDDVFFHYRGGSNWNQEGKKIHDSLMTYLHSVIVESVVSNPERGAS